MTLDDDDDIPETPIVTRRLVKLTRKKKQDTNSVINDKHETKNINSEEDEEDEDKNKIKSQERSKSLDVSKILGKMKNNSNYSGFISSSSFNSNVNNLKNWKTESLFDDDGNDELFPDLDIEKEIKKKKEIQREKKKEKDKEKEFEKQNENQNELIVKEKPKTKNKLTKTSVNEKPKNKNKIKNDLTVPLYPSSSPAKKDSLIEKEKEVEKETETEMEIEIVEQEPTIIPEKTIQKLSKHETSKKEIEEDNKKIEKSKVGKRGKIIKNKKQPVKITKKRKLKEMDSETEDLTPIPEKKLISNKKQKEIKNTKKGKSKKIDSSSFSLFDALDIHDNNDNKENDNGNDEVFVLDSPVKKTRKKKSTTSVISKTKGKTRSKSKTISKSPIENNSYDEIDDNIEFEKQQIIEEEKLLKEREQQQILAELSKHKKEEKLRQKLDREEKLKQQKIEKEIEKKERLELQHKDKIKQIKKKKKIETLNRLKESISSVMNNKSNVETIMIPLKNDINDTSNNNIKLRRSSLNARGRRLSSVGNGFTAIPHDDIPIDELHKHIDLTLPDSHKLKQLLVWITKRLINQGWNQQNIDNKEKGEENYDNDYDDDELKSKGNAICKIILEEFVDDLIQGRVDIDWWGSSKSSSTKSLNDPIIVHKNKANVENENKLIFYENELKKLQRESKIWQELKVKNIGTEYDLLLKEIETSVPPTSVLDKDSQVEENNRLKNIINSSCERIEKFERLVHRLNVSNDLIQRIMLQKNRLIAEKLKEQSQIDVLELLRGSKVKL